jgi:hypothetical protein
MTLEENNKVAYPTTNFQREKSKFEEVVEA